MGEEDNHTIASSSTDCGSVGQLSRPSWLMSETNEMHKIKASTYVSPNRDPALSHYWYSQVACMLFHPNQNNNVYQSVRHCLEHRIQKITFSLTSYGAWTSCFEDGNAENDLTNFEKSRLEAKIRCLKKAYEFAIDNMGKANSWKWERCANEASSFFCEQFGGWQYPKSGRTIMYWNMDFRRGEVFSRDKPMANKMNLPPLLQDNPDAYLNLKRVRKKSRRAREYMVAYFLLSINGASTGAASEIGHQVSIEELKACAVSAQKIEQMKKMVRTHRAALDFDQSFCLAAAVDSSDAVLKSEGKNRKLEMAGK